MPHTEEEAEKVTKMDGVEVDMDAEKPTSEDPGDKAPTEVADPGEFDGDLGETKA